jgi:hypothetical protein
MATSWMVTDFSGSPFTRNVPASYSMSATDTSSIPDAMICALSRTFLATRAAAAPDTGVEREP